MKVLHIFNELKFSGAEIMYVDAAPFFLDKGCDLTAMSTSQILGEYAPQFKKAGYKLLHHPYPNLKNYFSRILYYFKIIKLIKREEFDVIHIHRSNALWGMAFCAWVAGKQSIYTFHNVFSTHILTRNYYRLLRWSAKHIFGCHFQSISDSVYKNELNYFYNSTTKVYNWYSANRFYPATKEEKINIRKELKIPSDALVLISIGGCSNVKRHSEIIKALPKVLKNEKNCLYLHLGSGCSENEEQALALELGVASNIRFYGNQIDIRKYLIASDIYLMTSKFEGIPITTIEALACKVPAILYDVPGLRDFNSEGNNSVLIPEDHNKLAEEIIYIRNNPLIAAELSDNGKSFVDSKFSMRTNVNQIYQLYQK